MKALVKISFIFLLVVCTTSCSTSNSVVSNRLIQKRKYTKGWFVNHQSRVKSDEITQNEKRENIAVRNQDALIERVDREFVGRLEKRPLNLERKISTQESFGKTEKMDVPVVKKEDTKQIYHVIDSHRSEVSQPITSIHSFSENEAQGKSILKQSKSSGSGEEMISALLTGFILLLSASVIVGLFFGIEAALLFAGIGVGIAVLFLVFGVIFLFVLIRWIM